MKFGKILAAIASGAIALSSMAFSAGAASSIDVKLFAQDTSVWELCSGDAVTISGDGSYSVSADLKGYDLFATLYMKDVTEKAAPEDFANAVVTVDSIVLNDSVNLKLSQAEFPALNETTGVFDVCFLNQWADTYVLNAEKNGDSYNYIDESGNVVAVNNVTVNFTVSGLGGDAAATADTATDDAAAETAPAADATTDAATTGNAAAVAIVAVMAISATAAIAAKKRK